MAAGGSRRLRADHLVALSEETAGASSLFHEEGGGWAGRMDHYFMATTDVVVCRVYAQKGWRSLAGGRLFDRAELERKRR
jgi:hypothetical protein